MYNICLDLLILFKWLSANSVANRLTQWLNCWRLHLELQVRSSHNKVNMITRYISFIFCFSIFNNCCLVLILDLLFITYSRYIFFSGPHMTICHENFTFHDVALDSLQISYRICFYVQWIVKFQTYQSMLKLVPCVSV